jgi:molybdopterin converting factor subunit 1
MKQLVQIRYFAGIRELIGCEAEEIEISGSTKLSVIIAEIKDKHPELTEELDSCAVAVNMEIVDPEKTTLMPGDELAFLPPFGGG